MRLTKILILSLCVLLLVPTVAYASDLREEFTQELLEALEELEETDRAKYEALMDESQQNEVQQDEAQQDEEPQGGMPLPPSAQLNQEQTNSVTIEWGVIIVQSLIATILIYTIPVTIYRKLKRGKDEDKYKEKDPWER